MGCRTRFGGNNRLVLGNAILTLLPTFPIPGAQDLARCKSNLTGAWQGWGRGGNGRGGHFFLFP